MTNTPIAATEGGLLPVTQADRNAAARAYDQDGLFLESERASKGLLDDGYYCQAFARHRLATRTPSPSAGEDVLLRQLSDVQFMLEELSSYLGGLGGEQHEKWERCSEALEFGAKRVADARAALSSMRPVQEEGSLEPTCAQCGGLRDDLAPGRDPEELCDPCYDDAIKALKPVQEEGVGEDGDICRRCRGRHVVPDNIDPFGYPEDRPCPACTDGTWKGVAALAARRDVSEVLKKHEPAIRAAASALASHPEASPPSLGVEELREALIECGRAVGCLLTDQVSNEFLMLVPAEIKAKIEALSRVSGGV